MILRLSSLIFGPCGTTALQGLARYRAGLPGSVDLEFGSEGFEVGAGDGGPEKVREFFGVDDCLDFLTQTLWHSLEADFQRFEDGLLLGEDETFLTALLTTFADTLLAELFGE